MVTLFTLRSLSYTNNNPNKNEFNIIDGDKDLEGFKERDKLSLEYFLHDFVLTGEQPIHEQSIEEDIRTLALFDYLNDRGSDDEDDTSPDSSDDLSSSMDEEEEEEEEVVAMEDEGEGENEGSSNGGTDNLDV